ncbi:MAG: class I SAM-dependent methyltransferase [Acidobacteriota bacterium]|nr:class I SAM-dependent methyltransferase [Acidobacteriota bacterium]
MVESPRQDGAPAREDIQEAEYHFPYHFVPRYTEAGFVQSVTLRWGYLYWSYLRVVLDLVEELRPASLLDVGSGDGRLLAEVSNRIPDTRAVGVDTSERAVALARALSPGGEFCVGDVTEPGFLQGTYDAITLVEVLEHVPPAQLPAFRTALRKHLSPVGHLIVTVPTTNMDVQAKHYQHFDLDSLVAALGDGFVLERALYLNRQSRLCRLFDHLVTNRFFAVREPQLLAWLLRAYQRKYLYADSKTAMRIFAVFEAAPER